MGKFTSFILLCFLAAPLWAAPSLLDIDSWQLPEEPAEPAVTETQEPAAKPKKAKKKKSKAPELKVQMTEGNRYSVATSTRDVTDIDIMNKSAQELLTSLAGKDRFHILFNASLPVSSDTVIKATDGKEYAVAVFGDEEQNHYRLLVFKNDVEQPLIATAQDISGKLEIFKKYQLDTNITEAEIKRTFPKVTPQQFVGKEDQEHYSSYKLPGPLFVLFKAGKVAQVSSEEQSFSEYVEQLKGVVPQAAPVAVPQENIQAAVAEQIQNPAPAQKRKFSEIVYGPGYNRWGHEDPHMHYRNDMGNFPGGPNMDPMLQPGFDPLNHEAPIDAEYRYSEIRRQANQHRQHLQPGMQQEFLPEQLPEQQVPVPNQQPKKPVRSTIRR